MAWKQLRTRYRCKRYACDHESRPLVDDWLTCRQLRHTKHTVYIFMERGHWTLRSARTAGMHIGILYTTGISHAPCTAETIRYCQVAIGVNATLLSRIGEWTCWFTAESRGFCSHAPWSRMGHTTNTSRLREPAYHIVVSVFYRCDLSHSHSR